MADINVQDQSQAALDAAKAKAEEAKAAAQAKYDEAAAKAQALLDSLPTPKELLQSIQMPALPTTESVVDKIVPGQMTNTELLVFLAPANISLPGLDVNTLLQLGFVTQFREAFANVDTPKERQELVDKYYDKYVTENKEKYQRGISAIKTKFNSSKEKLDNLIKRIRSSVARIANPPVIGTAAPNPTRTLQDYIDLKQQAENELSAITVELIDVILLAEAIDWDLPEQFDILAQLIGGAKKALELIPV